MRTKVGLVILFVLVSRSVAAQWSPVSPFGSYDTTLGSRIQAAMQVVYGKTFSYEQHGVAASVIVPGLPQWDGAVGTSDDTKPMTPDLNFEIAKCTKSFTAALIFTLEDSGQLSISDPISNYISNISSYPNVDPQITIKQLLEHSSGLYDFIDDDPTNALFNDAYFTNPTKRWTPDEILQNYVKGRLFTAGAAYNYSNTDYLLLGMIAEKAAGDSLSKEIHRKLLLPLGLAHTSCGWADSVPTNFAHNFTAAPDENTLAFDLFSVNKTAQLSLMNSAGGMISSVADLAKWSSLLYSGKLLSNQAMSEMMTINDWGDSVTHYGRGVLRLEYGPKKFYGDSGSLPGFHTMMFTNPIDSVTFVICMNSDMDSNDVQISDYARAILREIYPTLGVPRASRPTEQTAIAYPNPFSDQTTISFQQDTPGASSLVVYDDLGREVRVIHDASEFIGEHALLLRRGELRAGAYHYVVDTPDGRLVGSLVVE